VQVRIEDGEPDYDIVEDRAYDFMEAESLPPIDNAALIYHGSLALRGDASRRCFRRLGETHDLPRFVDVNLRDPWWQRQQVRDLLRGASWVKLNEKELELLGDGPDDGAGERFRQAFGLQSLILTRGGEGAQLLGQGSVLDVAPEPAERVVDTVGAGDAFASIILLGLLNGWSEKLTLERAQSFASAMVGVRGATVQERDFYRHFAAVWGLASA